MGGIKPPPRDRDFRRRFCFNMAQQPVATIIDFGIAKATDRRLTDNELTTQLGIAVGRPAYMSPEQAEAERSQHRHGRTSTVSAWCSTSC
jgi:hypothetical protein